MPAHPDDRDALIRESRRVRSALDDLADLAGSTRPPPAAAIGSSNVPADADDLFDSFSEIPTEPEPDLEPASMTADAFLEPSPAPPADDAGWFDDPPLTPIRPSDRSTAEVEIVTPTGKHDTRQSSTPGPTAGSPPTEGSISEVLDDFDW